jgi:hypothetical protein
VYAERTSTTQGGETPCDAVTATRPPRAAIRSNRL